MRFPQPHVSTEPWRLRTKINMPRSHRKKEFYSGQTIRSIGSSNETNNATITVQYMEQKTQRKHGINNRKCGKSVKIRVNKTASTIQNRLCSCSKCTEMRLKEASNFKSCPGEAPRTPSHTYPAHAATRPSQVSYSLAPTTIFSPSTSKLLENRASFHSIWR